MRLFTIALGCIMRENLSIALDKVFVVEGGYVDDPNDNGGATNMGITVGTLSKWRNYEVTEDDVRNLTRNEATQIYKEWYWDPVKGDDLPSGVDIVVFDMAVNAGPRRASKLLQEVVGANPDGVIGPKTLEAVRASQSLSDTIKEYTQLRLGFYRSLDDWKHFGRGWTNRAEKVEEVALSVLNGQISGQVAPQAPTLPENKPATKTALQSLLRAILKWLIGQLKK